MGFHKNIDEVIHTMIKNKSLFNKHDLIKLLETTHYLYNLSWEKKGIKLAKEMRPVNFEINKDGSITILP